MGEVLLGIDGGTSAVKVCVFDLDGTLLRVARRPTPVITAYQGWAEIDPAHCWEGICSAIAEVMRPDERVLSVGLTGTCPTIVPLDAEGQPLRSGILYLDNRGRAEIDAIGQAVGGAEAFFERTGNKLGVSACVAATLRWLKRKEPETWERTRTLGFLNTFIATKLTGELATDPTHASYSGLYSLRGDRLKWDIGLCDTLGIDPAKLPPLREPYTKVGEVTAKAAEATGLEVGIPVAVGAADTAAAALAVSLIEPRSAFESMGTSGVITFCLDEPDFDPAFMNRCHVRPGLWLAHGAMSTLGGALGWIREKIWPEVPSFAELEMLAADSLAGANGVLFLPYLSGERSPIWDANASGCWVGLRLDTTKADMVRAVFEGGAYGLRQILSRAERHWGWKPENLLSVGGGTRSRGWFQIKADILGVEYLPADLPDAAAMGAALLGGIAGGIFTGVTDPTLPQVARPKETVSPGPNDRRAVYDQMFAVYEKLYPALKDSMVDLATMHPSD